MNCYILVGTRLLFLVDNYMIQKQQYRHLLSITESSLTTITLLHLSQTLSEQPPNHLKHFKLQLHQTSKPYNTALNLKLSLLSNSQPIPQPSKQKWIIISRQEIQELSNLEDIKAIFIMLREYENDDDGDLIRGIQYVGRQCFVVRYVKDVLRIVGMGEKEYRLRCWMEDMMRRSNSLWVERELVGNFVEIANKANQHYMSKSLKQLTKFMNFHITTKTRLLKKYLNFWTISHLTNQINQTQTELINTFTHTRPNKILLSKCFYSWRKISLSAS